MSTTEAIREVLAYVEWLERMADDSHDRTDRAQEAITVLSRALRQEEK